MGGGGSAQLSPVRKFVLTTSGCKANTTRTLENMSFEFTGECIDGFISGTGTLKLLTNGKLVYKSEGQYSMGSMLFGTRQEANGDIWEGAYLNGYVSGLATVSYANGNKYVGEFKNGKYNGRGTLALNYGTKYVGEFKDGKYDGVGTYFSSNGEIIREGVYRNGAYISPHPPIQSSVTTQETITQQQVEVINQPFTSSSISKRIALVIGNASYKTRPLRNPRNDADDVSSALKSTGFQVIDIRDATLQQMRLGVRQFGDRLINNDVGLVYYSGHGVEIKGRNYFIPVNTDIMREDEIADQGLDVSLILEKMNTAGKGVNILIVDACRDDPFGRSFRSSSRGLAQMDAPRGTIIAYATSPGKVAADGDGRNSPYTKNLVKAMQQPNKPIEQVFKEVRRAVQEETKNQQTPWENTSLSGDFYFKVQR